ncbi:glycosyltransferase family 2 protein [Sphingomonas sp. XXL09]|uniref:glycosyltransferase family 2 protein n=1 Tax=Sphingomonas sp. XXL09 TaxID=3457787 RepID=UPI00406BBD52
MNVITVIALLIAALPMAMLLVFTLEVAAGLRPLRRSVPTPSTFQVAILIPAHDEAMGIEGMLAALHARIDPNVSVLVVADNCTDDTAARARQAGATVIERHDSARRGKGYALAFGRDHLAMSPPDCVIVLDADCTIERDGIAVLAGAAMATGRAIQACYLQRPDRAASPKSQISSFAFLVKNLVRQRGMTRIGGVAAMTGTGMALPWSVLADAPLASADLAEDMALGAWLTRHRRPPLFLEDARVWSDAASEAALMTQRNRWERGFMSIARKRALPLIVDGIARGRRGSLWLGLHLLVPPLALLFVVAGAALVLVSILGLLGGSLLAPALLLVGLAAAAGATIAAWSCAGREQISGTALLRVPLYVAAKLPIYRTLLRREQADWVRTDRGNDDAPRQ